MKWFRLYSEARNDAKLRHLQDDEHRVWFNLMCFANEQKEQRGSIFFHSYTLLAVEVANGDEDLLHRTLEKLTMLRIVENEDGAISFINFGKRNYDNPSDSPEEVNKRVKKHRSKKRNDCVTTLKREVTTHNTDTDTDTDTEIYNTLALCSADEQEKNVSPGEQRKRAKTQEELFNEFWEAYPKKRSKGQAEKTWAKLKPDEQLVALMVAKIEQAKTSEEWTKQGGQYIPHPSSWLNAKGWEDEYTGGDKGVQNSNGDRFKDLYQDGGVDDDT